MPTTEWFETKVMIAAEEARRAGFSQTQSALLDVLRSSRCRDERMNRVFALIVSEKRWKSPSRLYQQLTKTLFGCGVGKMRIRPCKNTIGLSMYVRI